MKQGSLAEHIFLTETSLRYLHTACNLSTSDRAAFQTYSWTTSGILKADKTTETEN
jgi:hypothetical protein